MYLGKFMEDMITDICTELISLNISCADEHLLTTDVNPMPTADMLPMQSQTHADRSSLADS
jgi:hypothetical protein